MGRHVGIALFGRTCVEPSVGRISWRGRVEQLRGVFDDVGDAGGEDLDTSHVLHCEKNVEVPRNAANAFQAICSHIRPYACKHSLLQFLHAIGLQAKQRFDRRDEN